MRTKMIMVLAALLAGCARKEFEGSEITPPGSRTDRPPGTPADFSVQPEGRAVARVELHYGSGDCAPRMADGTLGTCIDGKPCYGFGFKNADGKIVCACFDTPGGCPQDAVCSIRKRACVREGGIDLQRSRTP